MQLVKDFLANQWKQMMCGLNNILLCRNKVCRAEESQFAFEGPSLHSH